MDFEPMVSQERRATTACNEAECIFIETYIRCKRGDACRIGEH